MQDFDWYHSPPSSAARSGSLSALDLIFEPGRCSRDKDFEIPKFDGAWPAPLPPVSSIMTGSNIYRLLVLSHSEQPLVPALIGPLIITFLLLDDLPLQTFSAFHGTTGLLEKRTCTDPRLQFPSDHPCSGLSRAIKTRVILSHSFHSLYPRGRKMTAQKS